jgi:MoaA/NifB/PqqE/SkfB family radical SAM enzyme
VARIVIELTDRCNLRCGHCFNGRHGGARDLPFHLLEKVVREAAACDIDHVSFTGGEATLYPRFADAIAEVVQAGCTFSFVSNGSTFLRHYHRILKYGKACTGVTFSLDGANEETHDRLRGTGSFRHVMRAATVCALNGLPFTFNTVVTARNRAQLRALVSLAAGLGSGGIRFGHLMPTRNTALGGLDLALHERRAVEEEIRQLQRDAPIAVAMAAGYYSESPFFGCAPLERREYNVDCAGNLTLCCQLSGHSPEVPTDIVANLGDASLPEACGRFERRVRRYLADKRAAVERGDMREADHFPCLYCLKYLGKMPAAAARPLRWHTRPAGVA